MKNRKLGRNDLCHCDSGKKYKHCCLFQDERRFMSGLSQDKDFNNERFFKRVQKQIGNDCTIVRHECFGVKMSEVILDLAGCLFEAAKTKQQKKTAIAITCNAWNIAVVEQEEKQKLFDRLLEKTDLVDQENMIEIINSIIEKKQKCYPELNRYIIDYNLTETKGHYNLSVIAALSKKEDLEFENSAHLEEEELCFS